jgi:hypothetical protein
VTFGPELARTYLAARNWPWQLLELDGGSWLATRRHPNSDTLIERRAPSLAGALEGVAEYENTHIERITH